MKSVLSILLTGCLLAACGPKATDNKTLAEKPNSMFSDDDRSIAEEKVLER